MVASVASATPSPALSRTGLQGELAVAQKERSACVNCASASTLEGKQNIQKLDSKIRTTQAELNAVVDSNAAQSADENRSSTAARQLKLDVYA